jgi:hypothetical protein
MEVYFQSKADPINSNQIRPIFIIDVDPAAYREYKSNPKSETAKPLYRIVNCKELFIVRSGSMQGVKEHPSKQELEATFGNASSTDKVMEYILEHGVLHHADLI